MTQVKDALIIRLLGDFKLTLPNGVEIEQWPRHKLKSLLTFLIFRRGTSLSAEYLCDLLWPDASTDKTIKTLRNRISELRQLLEPDLSSGKNSKYILRMAKGHYGFSTEAAVWVDTDVFLQHLKVGKQAQAKSQWAQALVHYERALPLYGGDFLKDDPYEEWMFAPRQHYQEHLQTLWLACSVCYEQLKQFDQARECAKRVVALNALHENAYQQLMRCHYLVGDRLLALQCFKTYKQALTSQMDLIPSQEIEVLYDQIATGKLTLTQSDAPHNLPVKHTHFIGREADCDTLKKRLTDPQTQWLTLVGSGGIGKTRLAIQVGGQVRQHFIDGVFFVSLVGLTSTDALLPAIADALPISFGDSRPLNQQLVDYLREKQQLLILDNFEQLLAGANLVSDLLTTAPGVTVMATSRQRLNLEEETLFAVSGLSHPEGSFTATLEELSQFPAIKLFMQRAGQLETLSWEKEQQALIRLGQLTQGHPLGLEMAASWVQVLSCKEIADGIESNFDLETTSQDPEERHQSMRAVFRYSYAILLPQEQAYFQKLCVFQEGFTHEAAAQVANTSLALLLSLLNKSLLHRHNNGCFAIHELLRGFGLELIGEHPKLHHQIQARHAAYYAAMTKEQESKLDGVEMKLALNVLSLEFKNILTAWAWAIRHGELGLLNSIKEGLFHYLKRKMRVIEGQSMFTQGVRLLVEQPQLTPYKAQLLIDLLIKQATFETDLSEFSYADSLLQHSLSLLHQHPDPDLKAHALHRIGRNYANQGDLVKGRQFIEQSLSINRTQNNQCTLAFVVRELGVIECSQGNYDQAQQHLHEALVIGKKIENLALQAICLSALGNIYQFIGNYPQAQRCFSESMHLNKQLDNPNALMFNAEALGTVALLQLMEEDEPAARETYFQTAYKYYQQALPLARQIGDPRGISVTLDNLGEIHQLIGQPQQAKKILEESLAIHQSIDYHLGVVIASMNLANALLDMDEIEQARPLLHNALKLAWETEATPQVVEALLGMARILVEDDRTLAVELLQFIVNHPALIAAINKRAVKLLNTLSPQRSPNSTTTSNITLEGWVKKFV